MDKISKIGPKLPLLVLKMTKNGILNPNLHICDAYVSRCLQYFIDAYVSRRLPHEQEGDQIIPLPHEQEGDQIIPLPHEQEGDQMIPLKVLLEGMEVNTKLVIKKLLSK